MHQNAKAKTKQYQSVDISWAQATDHSQDFSAASIKIKAQLFLIRCYSFKILSQDFYDSQRQGKYIVPLMKALIGIYLRCSLTQQKLSAYVDCTDTMLAKWVAHELHISNPILSESFLKGIRRARKYLKQIGLITYGSGVNDRATLYGLNIAYQLHPELKMQLALDSHLSSQHYNLFQQADPITFLSIKSKVKDFIKIERKKVYQEIRVKTFAAKHAILKLTTDHNKIIYKNYQEANQQEKRNTPKPISHLLLSHLSTPINSFSINNKQDLEKKELTWSDRSKAFEIKLLISDLEKQTQHIKKEILINSRDILHKTSWGKAVENYFHNNQKTTSKKEYQIVSQQPILFSPHEPKKEIMQIQSWYKWLCDEVNCKEFQEVSTKFKIKFIIEKSEAYKPTTAITKEQSSALYNFFTQQIKLNDLMTISGKNGKIDQEKDDFEKQSFEQTNEFLNKFFQGDSNLIDKIKKVIFRYRKD